tara:strand:- start:4615 stop:5400 length:786 start_codon:yes stop_codon:yes gene_type:complete
MAVNVNTVYQTVLLILNKEQRGYITPQEFNDVATQVQLEIFNKYFEDLNQQLRVPQTDMDYADRILNVDEKLSILKTFGRATYNNTFIPSKPFWELPTVDDYGRQVEVYTLGAVTLKLINQDSVEIQRLQRNEFYNIQNSKLTKSTEKFPTYLLENNNLFISPNTITNTKGFIDVDFIRKPLDPIWGFTVGSLGQYNYDFTNYDPTAIPSPTGSRNFELDGSEQTNIILKILEYSGIIINDPTVIQAASQKVQIEEINEKS